MATFPPDSAAKPQRLEALDRIRGVAVLGILLLNIVGFGMPGAAYDNPRAYGGWHGADLLVWAVNFVLFDGKMRGLFSFLFGASILLVAERAKASGCNAARVHYTRMAWLLVFGVAHLLLVWDGDILAHYALVGAFAFSLRHLPTERLVILALLLIAVATAMFALVPLQVWTLQHAAMDPAQVRQLQSLQDSFGVPSARSVAQELARYRGGYGQIVRARIVESGANPFAMLFFYGPETLAYMLLGMAALRNGMLAGGWQRQRYRRWLGWCWGIALPVHLVLAAWLIASGFGLLPVTLGVLTLTAPFRPLMILGWICLVQLALRSDSRMAARLSAAGRMAFTNYLTTSLLCTTLFYGYGLGWYGRLSRWQLYPIVALVWALILLWSPLWLAHFRFGPLEWLWRSLARGTPQPMRRSSPK